MVPTTHAVVTQTPRNVFFSVLTPREQNTLSTISFLSSWTRQRQRLRFGSTAAHLSNGGGTVKVHPLSPLFPLPKLYTHEQGRLGDGKLRRGEWQGWRRVLWMIRRGQRGIFPAWRGPPPVQPSKSLMVDGVRQRQVYGLR